MQELTKQVKRKLRELLRIAHERALAKEFEKLESDFVRWRAGEFDAHELSARVHTFHNGTARDLFEQYAANGLPEWTLARAIIDGFVTEAEAGPEVLAALETPLREIRESLSRQ